MATFRSRKDPAMTASVRPLDGIRILDFTRVLAGPSPRAAGRPGRRGDQDRTAAGRRLPRHRADEERPERALRVMNRNKKSMVLDLKHPDAVRLVRELAACADVVVENFRPGVAERLGIGPDALLRLNPKLVYVSVSGFGQTSPYAHRPAYDIIVQAMSGLMEATGDPDGPPTLVGEAMSDVVAGLPPALGHAGRTAADPAHRPRPARRRRDVRHHAELSRRRSMARSSSPASRRARSATGSAVGALRRLSRAGRPLRAGGPQQEAVRCDGRRDGRSPHSCRTRVSPPTSCAPRRSRRRPADRDWAGRIRRGRAPLDARACQPRRSGTSTQALESPQAQARELLREVNDDRLPGLGRTAGALQRRTQPQHARARARRTHRRIARKVLGSGLDKLAELRSSRRLRRQPPPLHLSRKRHDTTRRHRRRPGPGRCGRALLRPKPSRRSRAPSTRKSARPAAMCRSSPRSA